MSSRQPNLQIQFLDLAALWLTDNGFRANAGVYANGQHNLVEGLSTDAPDASVNIALVKAYTSLCDFLVEELKFETGDLPMFDELRPIKTSIAKSRYQNGQVFGYV